MICCSVVPTILVCGLGYCCECRRGGGTREARGGWLVEGRFVWGITLSIPSQDRVSRTAKCGRKKKTSSQMRDGVLPSSTLPAPHTLLPQWRFDILACMYWQVYLRLPRPTCTPYTVYPQLSDTDYSDRYFSLFRKYSSPGPVVRAPCGVDPGMRNMPSSLMMQSARQV